MSNNTQTDNKSVARTEKQAEGDSADRLFEYCSRCGAPALGVVVDGPGAGDRYAVPCGCRAQLTNRSDS